MAKEIIQSALEKSQAYAEYRELLERLFEVGKHTGEVQQESFLKYTELNLTRLRKWEKRFELQIDTKQLFENLSTSETWLVITEGWCGDAAHSMPVMQKMAESSNDRISLRVVLRDENPELMDQFLTNGARSIPKLIRLQSDDLSVLGTWGSAPEEVKNLKKQMKAAGEEGAEISKAVQLWYARNRGKSIEAELAAQVAEHQMT